MKHSFYNPYPADAWVDELSRFIMDECPGYPDGNYGAIECAIKIIRDMRSAIDGVIPLLEICEKGHGWENTPAETIDALRKFSAKYRLAHYYRDAIKP